MAIELITGFRSSSREALDKRSGPYETLQEAYNALGPYARYVGLSVDIITGATKDPNNYIGGTLTRYVFNGGIDDIHLVPFQPALDAGDISTGILPVVRGGTGVNFVTENALLTGNGSGALTSASGLTYDGTTLSVTDNVSIDGNLVVNGSTYFVGVETIDVSSSYIFMNTGIVGAPPLNLQSGIIVGRGNEDPYAILYDEHTQQFRLGVSNWNGTHYDDASTQAAATREDAPINMALTYWNGAKDQLITSPNLTFDGSSLTANTIIGANVTTGSDPGHTHTAYDNYVSWTAQDDDGTNYTITSGDTLQFKNGTGIDTNFTGDDVLTFTNTDRGSSQNIFKNIAVATQSTVVADNNNDTLTLVGLGTTAITTSGDTITITSNDQYDGTVTSVTGGTALSGTITTSGSIDHLTTTGYKHIPSGGSATQILEWSADGTVNWANPAAQTLAAQTDVTITSIGTNEILQWNGSTWINRTLVEAGINLNNYYEKDQTIFTNTEIHIESTPLTFDATQASPGFYMQNTSKSGTVYSSAEWRQNVGSDNLFKWTAFDNFSNASSIQYNDVVTFSKLGDVDIKGAFKVNGVAIGTGAGTVTSVSASGALSSSGGTAPEITHSALVGYKHIPTGGTVGQILKNTSSGTATWQEESGGTTPNLQEVVTAGPSTSENIDVFSLSIAGTPTISSDRHYTGGTGTFTTLSATDTVNITPAGAIGLTIDTPSISNAIIFKSGGNDLTKLYTINGTSAVLDVIGTISGINVTSGADPGHTHTAYDKYTSWTAKDSDGTSYAISSESTLQFKNGTGIDVDFSASNILTFINTNQGSAQNIFKNIAVTGQNTVVADNNNDTLTLVGAGNINITTNNTADTITITSSTAYLPISGGSLTGDVHFNNHNIIGLNSIVFNDPGVSAEGLRWGSPNSWEIGEDTDTLSNASGNMQFVSNNVRRATMYHDTGNFWCQGIMTATGGNSTEWNSAYTHAGTSHAPSNATSAGATGDAHAGTSHAPSDANNYSFPYTVSDGESNSTVVKRTSNGYVHAKYFNATGSFSASGAASGMGNFIGTNGSDTYARSYSAAGARALLNVENGATADQTSVSGSSGSCTGNAASATKLATARTIDITGDITATAVSFNGTANIAISASVNDNSHKHTGLYRSDSGIDSYNVKSHWGGIISGYWGLRGYSNDSYHAPVAVGYASTSAACSGNTAGSSSSCTGNAATASTANLIKVNSYDGTTIMRLLGSHQTGGSDNVYSTTGITMNCATDSLYATGNITAYYSDERLKEKTGLIENAIDKVKSLDAFFYVENDLAKSLGYNNTESQIGLSAQQVQSILPEIVTLAPIDIKMGEDGEICSKSGENYLTVDYAKVSPLLIAAIKEQQNTIEIQQKMIARQQLKMDKQEKIMESLIYRVSNIEKN